MSPDRGTSIPRLYDNAEIMNITTEEIDRAIYLDFESKGKRPNKDQPPPVLGGTLIEGIYTPALLHPDLVHASRANEWGHATLAEHCESIREQANAENRRIIFFSSEELTPLNDHGLDLSKSGFDLREQAQASGLYKDVWTTFDESQRRFTEPDTAQATRDELRTKSFDLITLIAQELGLQRPDSYGAGKTGARIRYALKHASSKDDYESWSPGAKRKLMQAVDHNQHDCRAIHFVLDHLAKNS